MVRRIDKQSDTGTSPDSTAIGGPGGRCLGSCDALRFSCQLHTPDLSQAPEIHCVDTLCHSNWYLEPDGEFDKPVVSA
jgi:hypothetical protein